MIIDWRSIVNFKCSYNFDWELIRYIFIFDVKRKQKGKRVESLIIYMESFMCK